MTTELSPSSSSSSFVDDESGKLILQGRIRSASGARSLYSMMWNSDQVAARNRARVKNMVDGGGSKDSGAAATAATEITNINWGDGEQAVHDECAPYFNLVFSSETFGSTPLQLDYADEATRQEHEGIISEEMSRMVRNWDNFIPYRLTSILECKTHGLSFDYRTDDIDWRWETAGLECFKLPRPCKIGVEKIPYCGVQIEFSPEELYQKIKNEEVATLAGWNVPAVRAFLMKAAPVTPGNSNWERWEDHWKNNDYLMGNEKSVCIAIAIFAKELNGTISQYIIPESGTSRTGEDEEFLYKRIGRFPRMGSFVHVYMDNIGTNKHYHAIRGMAQRIYSAAQELNRKTNNFSDLIDFASMPVFQSSEMETDTEATSQAGPYLILNPGWTMPERAIPNYGQSLIPAIQLFTDKLHARTSRIAPPSAGDPRMHPEQFQAQLNQSASLSDSDFELFLSSWEAQWCETVRRASREGYLPVEPGGQEVAEMKRRLKQRGIHDPERALKHVDWKNCKAERGLGAGSAAAKMVILNQLEPIINQLDPIAQGVWRRMYVMAHGGVQLANTLTPKDQTRRLPVDASIADATNSEIMAGIQIPVREGQNHIVIAGVRLGKLQELNAQMAEQGEPAMAQAIPAMHNLLMDLEAHIQKANQSDPQVKQIIELAQRFNETVTNGVRHLQKVERKRQAEMEHNAGKIGNQQAGPDGQPLQPQGPPQDASNGQQIPPTGQPEDQVTERRYADSSLTASIKLQEKLSNLKFIEAKNQQFLTQQQRKFEQDQKIADLKAAAEIRRR